MCLFEMGSSTAAISLSGLLDGETPSCPDPGLGLRDVLDLIVVGGWPVNLGRDTETAAQSNIDYLAHVREVDVPSLTGTHRDPGRLARLLSSLARTTATEAKIAVLARETLGTEGPPLARSTIYDYLSALERLMLVEDVPAWAPHLRSKATLGDLNYAGFLFESMVVRELRVLAAPLGCTATTIATATVSRPTSSFRRRTVDGRHSRSS